MTLSAWLMLAGTWTVVIFFAARFFLAILRTPAEKRDDPD